MLGGFLTSVGLIAAHEAATSPDLMVQHVRFVGNERVGDIALRHLADLRTGTPLWRADLQRAVRGVERHPWVASASARRIVPGVVEIAVVEREPSMLLALDDLWVVDDEGVPFRRASSETLDFPVVTGVDPHWRTEAPARLRAVVWGARRVLDAAAAEGIAEDDVSEVHLDPSLGYVLVLRSGARLVAGWQDPTPRLARIGALRAAGVDLTAPVQVDLDGAQVAVVTPLPTLIASHTAPGTRRNSP